MADMEEADQPRLLVDSGTRRVSGHAGGELHADLVPLEDKILEHGVLTMPEPASRAPEPRNGRTSAELGTHFAQLSNELFTEIFGRCVVAPFGRMSMSRAGQGTTR
jgi:hypothetical protein